MLQTLMEYGAKLDSEPGFKTREVRWLVKLDAQGRLQGVLPLGDGKRGQMLPRCPDMHNMNAGGRAHFLVESAQTATLLFKANEDEKKIASAQGRHQFFAGIVRQAADKIGTLRALTLTLETPERIAAVRDALAEKKAKPTDWVGWQIDDRDPRDDAAVQAWWRDWRRADKNTDSAQRKRAQTQSTMRCFITGELTDPLPTHPKISGLSGVGGLSMGDVLVGFDKAAFGSFGLDQSANAAMDASAAQQYADGLNDLIRNHFRKLANALVVHWFKDNVPAADDPLAWLEGMESDEQVEAAAQARARELLDAIRSGVRADLGRNLYYAMTLSGASGRVMVRDWMEGAFEELVRNVGAWFADLAIVARDGAGLARDPKFMAVGGALVRDLKDLPAPTAATLWQAAVRALPIPRPLLAQALARFRADLVDKDQPPFNHARMGLIKAYFARRLPKGDSAMTAYLNPDHPDPAYHCGRLLAVLASLQRAALGDVGAGVVQRYYAAASQTPGLILGRLAANARNHLGKLEGGRAFWFEEKIADVMGRLGDRVPRILDLEGQGLFALGYYQQLAELRKSAKTGGKDAPDSTNAAQSGDQQ